MKSIAEALAPVIDHLNATRPTGTQPITTRSSPMKVQITANVRDAEYRVTLYDGGPDDDSGDLAGLLGDAGKAILAAERAA